MIIKKAEYLKTAVYTEQFPQTTFPEIVFSGRSNVGKSSLINMLVDRKKLAYFSRKPGKTQTLNFYNVNDALLLVDIPGYGYAKVSHKQREAFAEMIENYFETREQCTAVCLLVDARHKPTPDDVQMFDFLHYYGIPMIIVGTKSDKISKNKMPAQKKLIQETLGFVEAEGIPIIMTSAEKGLGKNQVWGEINRIIFEKNKKK